MSWIDLFRMSSGNLRRRKLRTFLTVLGVVIGTASIVVMVSLGLGMQEALYAQVEQMGGVTNLKISGKGGDSGMSFGPPQEKIESNKFVTDQAVAEFGEMEHVKSSYPVLQIPIVLLKGKYMSYADLYGIPGKALTELKIPLEEESRLPENMTSNLELMFGNWMPEMFYNKSTGKGFWETGELPDFNYSKDQFLTVLDQEAYSNYEQSGGAFGSINDKTSDAKDQKPGEVKGAPKKYVSQGVALVSGGMEGYNAFSNGVYCNLDTLKGILKKEFAGKKIPGQPLKKSGKPYNYIIYSYANIQVDEMENVEIVSKRFKDLGYNVESNAEFLESAKSQFAVTQAVLGGIGAISLLVAAIGITNTMMMSIYERTKEIGVLKVLGCGLKNIKQLFLMEAAGIGLLGGLLGNMLSFILSKITNSVAKSSETLNMAGTDISFIPWWLMLAAMGIAVSVAMFAGYFPARRAMKLSPLEAIRTN